MFLDRLLATFRARRKNYPVLRALYGAIMAQARQPYFFAELKVPDTVDGRFDMVILHTYLVVARLRHGGETAEALSQDLFDHMFRDMDQALREMGVGDMGIGKRIQKMAAKFYGRGDAYDAGLEADDDMVLQEAIARNIFAAQEAPMEQVAALAGYMRAARQELATQSLDDICAGRLRFPAPDVAAA
jgi:cytochrome b pre-mRNA-processing protein 3